MTDIVERSKLCPAVCDCDGEPCLLYELRAEIERLRHERECMLEIIADWANEEGIGFDQTTRLSRALGLEPKPPQTQDEMQKHIYEQTEKMFRDKP